MKALSPPSGPEWDAVIAAGEWPRLKAEADKIACAAPKGCGGCCEDIFKMKKALDEQWTPKANEELNKHGLKVEIIAFYTSDGKSSHPHLWMQFFKA